MEDHTYAFVPRTYRGPTIYTKITLLQPSKMARRGRFHVLPADNTFPIEDFDMFKAESKAPIPRRVPQNVRQRRPSDLPLSCDSANGYSRVP